MGGRYCTWTVFFGASFFLLRTCWPRDGECNGRDCSQLPHYTNFSTNMCLPSIVDIAIKAYTWWFIQLPNPKLDSVGLIPHIPLWWTYKFVVWTTSHSYRSYPPASRAIGNLPFRWFSRRTPPFVESLLSHIFRDAVPMKTYFFIPENLPRNFHFFNDFSPYFPQIFSWLKPLVSPDSPAFRPWVVARLRDFSEQSLANSVPGHEVWHIWGFP